MEVRLIISKDVFEKQSQHCECFLRSLKEEFSSCPQKADLDFVRNIFMSDCE